MNLSHVTNARQNRVTLKCAISLKCKKPLTVSWLFCLDNVFLKKSYIILRQAVRIRRWDDPIDRVHPVGGGIKRQIEKYFQKEETVCRSKNERKLEKRTVTPSFRHKKKQEKREEGRERQRNKKIRRSQKRNYIFEKSLKAKMQGKVNALALGEDQS